MREHELSEHEHFERCPRYDMHELTDAQIEAIAERAAIKAVELARKGFYEGVGKGVVTKFLWMVGIVVVAAFTWTKSKGL